MSALWGAVIGGGSAVIVALTLRWAWEHVPYLGLGLFAALCGALVGSAVACIFAPSPAGSLSRFYRFLGLLLYMLPKSDRETWFIIQADLREDVIEMRVGGFSRSAIRFIILWRTAIELSGLLWNCATRLAPLQVFQWTGKSIGIVVRKFIGTAK